MIADEVPIPVPRSKEMLVRVNMSLISTGSETSSLKKYDRSFVEKINEKKKLVEKVSEKLASEGLKPTWEAILNKLHPTKKSLVLNPIGYSNAGIVVAKGDQVRSFNIDDRVACAGSGIAVHAEFVVIPVNLAVKIPDSLSFEKAAFTTVGSIALQGVRRAHVSGGETVVMIGLGLIGLLSVQIAKAWGLVVIGIDLQKERMKLARSLGADECFSAEDVDIENKIMSITSGVGADAVIITAATRSSTPANQALAICRRKGRVVVVGSIGMNLEREAMYKKELDFVISTSYGPGRYDPDYEVKGNDYPIGYVRWTENRNMQEFVRLLAENRVKTGPLVSRVFPVEQAVAAYDFLVNTQEHNITVLFSYPTTDIDIKAGTKITLQAKPVLTDRINAGVIGAGGFASRIHLPNLLRLSKYFNLTAISVRNPATAKMSGRKFKPRYVTTDYREILSDTSVDMVIVTTRHNSHAEIVTESLQAGKHVLVEKPLAMNHEELQRIKQTLEDSNCFLAVGFNRRYSPLSITARKMLNKKGGPCFINYRVNAGYIPNTHWVQDPVEGGGRIIGECCHFLDLFNFFIESDIKHLQVATISVDAKKIHAEDNIAITVSYKNGSVAVLSYVSLGAKSLPKERIEIFSGNSCMVLNDFVTMEMYDCGEKNIRLKEMDKGHLRELEEFAKLIRGEKSLIPPVEKAIQVTEKTFDIVAILKGA